MVPATCQITWTGGQPTVKMSGTTLLKPLWTATVQHTGTAVGRQPGDRGDGPIGEAEADNTAIGRNHHSAAIRDQRNYQASVLG
ncbi:hypothetical protein KIPE111705_28450 [Kibdelosporangium persicum]